MAGHSTVVCAMQVTVLTSGEKLEAFLQRCGGGDGKAKKGAKSGAAWGGCVLLFSDKKQTSPLYKSLAAQYAGKLAFGEVCHTLIGVHTLELGSLSGRRVSHSLESLSRVNTLPSVCELLGRKL